jgi:hypothetical protein
MTASLIPGFRGSRPFVFCATARLGASLDITRTNRAVGACSVYWSTYLQQHETRQRREKVQVLRRLRVDLRGRYVPVRLVVHWVKQSHLREARKGSERNEGAVSQTNAHKHATVTVTMLLAWKRILNVRYSAAFTASMPQRPACRHGCTDVKQRNK